MIWPHATDFLAYRTVVLRFFKMNIKARHEIKEKVRTDNLKFMTDLPDQVMDGCSVTQ